MVVQHNLTAMNSNRMLGLTTASQAKSTEKLSSGYKINRAADDAAGLSISEKMRKQIRGLTQATANAQDGISAVQTAEGALTEVHDMLQRMNELAVKSSNETMSEDDRSYVQNEIDQLVTEIDRVAETTKFNETYLLKGDETSNGYSRTLADDNTVLGTVDGFTVSTRAASQTVKDGDKLTVGTIGITSSNTDIIADVDGATTQGLNDDQKDFLEKLNSVTTTGTGANVSVTFKDGTTGAYTKADFESASGLTLKVADGTTSLSKGFTAATAGVADAAAATGAADAYKYGEDVSFFASVNSNGSITLNGGAEKALVLDLQVGADTTTSNKITLKLDSMSAKSLGIEGLKVDGKDSTKADEAVNVISSAIQKVSTQRSALGAVQNRLEHTINNLGNVVENTTSAEASIRDTDMATEMVKYSNNNILSQAGQAMLAQANQSNQGVLSLLG